MIIAKIHNNKKNFKSLIKLFRNIILMNIFQKHLKNFLLEYAKKHKIKKLEDWYKINLSNLNNDLRFSILSFGWSKLGNVSSTSNLIQLAYPKKKIYPWLFINTPNFFWHNKINRINYVKWLEKKLKIKKLDDWYNVSTRKDVYKNKGVTIIKIKKSLINVLSEAYPNKKWYPWLFKVGSQGYLNDKKNHRLFLEYIIQKEKLSLKNSSIYKLNSNTVKKYGGVVVLREYENFVECIIKNFPEIKFDRFKFIHNGRGFWEDKNNHRIALLYLGQKLGFKKKEDWYAIQYKDFANAGMTTLPSMYKDSPAKVCISLLKEFKFDHTKFDFSSKYEFRARCYAKCLFGIKNILSNARFKKYKYKKTGRSMEFDIFIPYLKVAIEYNGEQHYRQRFHNTKIDFIRQLERDKEKIKTCQQNKIKLIIIKYSKWNGMPETFIKILKKHIDISDNQIKYFWRRFKKEQIYKEVLKEIKKI